MITEIKGLCMDYLSPDTRLPTFNLILIPQSKDQEISLAASGHKIRKIEGSLHGSSLSYIAGSYYSQQLAEKMRIEFVNLFKCYVTIEKF